MSLKNFGSARKLKCPSSARNLPSSARAGKFQLGLITTAYIYKNQNVMSLELWARKSLVNGFIFQKLNKTIEERTVWIYQLLLFNIEINIA